MAKYAVAVLALFALVAVCTAQPIGMGLGGVVSKNHHVSHSQQIISPYMGLGLGYGMMGLGGLGHIGGIGHSISSHSSVGHVVPHLGLGIGHMGMKGLYGMYPGGIGMGYGLGMMG